MGVRGPKAIVVRSGRFEIRTTTAIRAKIERIAVHHGRTLTSLLDEAIDDVIAKYPDANTSRTPDEELRRLRNVLRRCMGGANHIDLGDGTSACLYLEPGK